MRTLYARRLELPAALAFVAATCSPHLSVAPSVGPLGASQPAPAVCPNRIASVDNRTTGAVNVVVDRKVEGHAFATLLGMVDAKSTAEFPLTRDEGSTLRFEWTSGSGSHDTHELKDVRYKIRCNMEIQES